MKNLSIVLMVLVLPFMSFNNADKRPTAPPVKEKVKKATRRNGADNITVVNNTPYSVSVDIKISLGPNGAVNNHYTLTVPGNQSVSTPSFDGTCSYVDGNNTTYMLVEWTSSGPAAASSYQFFFADGTTYGCKYRTTRNGGLGTYLDGGCGTQFLFLYNTTNCGS
ncbi:hypothetical protein [Chitinophaga sp. CF418]|uniref:hypothetical protein n=1 Tax=Chitinophaga sp. CF418 TaxID=1855287 RepID=UPI000913E4F0|nr:hypothetical protein [Chitinophaga sp. CF418]SHN33932.1 hypothetical protein SAMN05216311_109224 [Chitinophaga sp. CF418]